MSSKTQSPKERLDALLGKSLEELYGTAKFNRAEAYKKNLNDRFEESLKKGKEADFVDLVEDIFNERKEALRHRNNVVRQVNEIDSVKFTPANSSIKSFLDPSHAFNPNATIEEIKNQDKSIVHLRVPNYNYRKNVIFAGLESQDRVKMNNARFESLIDSGQDISKDEQERLKGVRSQSREFKEKIGTVVGVIHKGVDQIGKGIFSKTNAVDLQGVAEYNTKKAQLANDLKSQLNPNSSNYSQLLQKLMSKLYDSNQPLDEATQEKMSQMIKDGIKQEDAEYKVRMDKFNDDVKKLEEEMLSDMQKNADNSDGMWQSRVISMFLILTPIGAFSIAGEVFNYLEPFKDFIGPIFEANKGLGEGFADMITNEKYFGPLGKLMDLMEVDKAVEGIFDLPLINQFSDLFEVMKDSDIGQGLINETASITSGAAVLPLLGIGVIHALTSVPKELEHHKKIKGDKKKHNDALVEAFKDLRSDLAKGWKETKKDDSKVAHKGSDDLIKDFVNKKYDILQDADRDLKMCKFFLDNVDKSSKEPLFEALFKDDTKSFLQYYNEGKFNDEKGVVSVNSVLDFLNDPEAKGLKEKARENFLRLGAVDDSVIEKGELSKSVDKTMIDQVSDADKKESKKKFGEKFYQDLAQNYGMGDAKMTTEQIAVRFKEMDVMSMKSDLDHIKTLSPSTRFSPVNCTRHDGTSLPTYKNNLLSLPPTPPISGRS